MKKIEEKTFDANEFYAAWDTHINECYKLLPKDTETIIDLINAIDEIKRIVRVVAADKINVNTEEIN